MNKLWSKLIKIALLFTFLISSTSFAQIQTNSLAPMLEKITPAVVNIRAILKITDLATLQALQKQQNQNQQNSGLPADKVLSVASGVVVDGNKGYILTNAHVIANAEQIVVTLDDGRHFSARIIGTDKPSDIALLQIRARNLPTAVIGDSNNLKVGDFVAAIGNPFGLNQTVTSGIVSGLGRTTLGIENYENFIQTDAPINPGNSGGALVNSEGQLIGINTAILAPARGSIGIGFAIPSNMAKSVMAQLIQYGDVKRGALGIGAQDITPELAAAFNLNITKGAVVTEVMPNSPAEKAGLKVGDLITKIDNANILNANDVINAVAFVRVDSTVHITALREGKTIEISTILTDPVKRKQINQESDPFLYGVSLKDFTILSPVHGNVAGVLVVTVNTDSNAWRGDLAPGDIIISANQQKVTTIPELKKIASEAKDTLLLNVLRGDGAMFVVINKEIP